MNIRFTHLITPLLAFSFGSLSLADTTKLEELVVTASLSQTSVLNMPASVSVFDAKTVANRNAQHLEELLNLAPNVNFAQGASRGRFIQIRGIGERSEFVDPVTYSVGVLLDGIDLTGLGTAATTLDVQQIEILRGPHGTEYGANALAGLIKFVSARPTDEFYGEISAQVAEYDTRTISGVISTPLGDKAGLRVSAMQHNSDGYMTDVFLGRDDTDNLDEFSSKAVLTLNPSDNLSIDTTLLYTNIDNGYDAFSLDNTRDTYSDQPGFDRQEMLALATTIRMGLSESLALEATLSHVDANSEYSYDEDWSHTGICDGTVCDSSLFGFDWFYSSFDNYLRDHKNSVIDLRVLSQNTDTVSWVAGVYWRDQSIDLNRIYTFDTPLSSTIDTSNVAVYGQTDIQLSDALTLTAGLRFEQFEADYSDNRAVTFAPNEGLWGGKIALSYQLSDTAKAYGLVSRGYKTGGFNTDGSLPIDRREYDTEFQWNYEIGVKGQSDDGAITAQISVFYQDRDDIQTKQSIVNSIATGIEGDPCPCNFTDYTDNGPSASSQGIEVEAHYVVSETFEVFASAGWLDAEFDEFNSFSHIDADDATGTPRNLKGREVAHAPHYQYAAGVIVNLTDNLHFQADAEGKDEFFFSDRHDIASDSFNLINARISYEQADWSVSIWGKNLTDELYQTRGFGSFGNDPRKFYATEEYNQFGAPRVVGASGTYRF